jgi:hypothetical protein
MNTLDPFYAGHDNLAELDHPHLCWNHRIRAVVGFFVGFGVLMGLDVGRFVVGFKVGDFVVGCNVGDIVDTKGIPGYTQLYPSAARENCSLYPNLWRYVSQAC